MASRLSLGRIVEWAKNADAEELGYVLGRLTVIARDRVRKIKQADAQGEKKRTRRTKAQIAADKASQGPGDPQAANAANA